MLVSLRLFQSIEVTRGLWASLVHIVRCCFWTKRAPQESNETGMMYISSASASLGYWNRPAETEAAFVLRDQKRWYKTGDIVRRDPNDGFIYVGRRDRMVKRRGNRIELGEIAQALFAHPGLHEAAVIAIPDSEEGDRITAFVAIGPPKPSIIELKTHCAKALPAYMVPDYFVFVDSLPCTSTGKTDYPELRRSRRLDYEGVPRRRRLGNLYNPRAARSGTSSSAIAILDVRS